MSKSCPGSASIAGILIILLSVGNAHAQNIDKLKVSAGGFSVFRYDSSMSLTSPTVGLGVAFSPVDTLGWKGEQTVLRLDGRYRFTNKHALSMSWYHISNDGERAIQKDIEWLDRNGNVITIPLGATVNSSLDYDIVKLAYQWSFYHNDKVELSVGGGFHLTDIEVKLAASATNTGERASEARSLLPLPVISFRLGYDVTSKLNWYLQTELFSLSIDDWDGIYTDLQLDMEYRVIENLGLGIGLGTNSLKVSKKTDKSHFDYDNRVTCVHLFVSGNF